MFLVMLHPTPHDVTFHQSETHLPSPHVVLLLLHNIRHMYIPVTINACQQILNNLTSLNEHVLNSVCQKEIFLIMLRQLVHQYSLIVQSPIILWLHY